MSAIEIKKSDWKLFRERLPKWQEKYMERLVKEYADYLQSNLPASMKFWEMEKDLEGFSQELIDRVIELSGVDW